MHTSTVYFFTVLNNLKKFLALGFRLKASTEDLRIKF
jgi:hypothetical protein